MINVINKKDCCGCGACMNVCPKKCIDMKADYEGFLYPIIDKNQCIECNLCEKVCPIISNSTEKPCEQKAYVVQIKDDDIRKESTAGGAFTAIADFVLERDGVVFGVAYDESFNAKHMKIENKSELFKFRNSKYVQSDTGTTYSQVKRYLNEGRWVCYSGTPCQIEGLYSFLQKEYERLITVDVVCHAVPSPLIWEKYVDMQKSKYGADISNIMFRDKHYGYKYSTMTVKNSAGVPVYTFGIDTDPMLRAFFSNICDRPSCYDCQFKKRYRVSDFTIWDCYTIDEFDKTMDDDKGTTRVLIHTTTGERVFNDISEKLKYTDVLPDELTKNVKEMYYSVEQNKNREEFFSDAHRMSGKELFDKYFPENMKVKLERTVRIICYKLGIYSFAKKIFKQVIKNKR